MVAMASQTLCNSAGAVIQGTPCQDKLVAAANAVSSSTAHLIVTCQVKANPESQNFQRLQVKRW